MDEKMAYVVIVDDINEAMALIREADEGFPFDDNGGDPDGPSWIVEPGDLGRALGPIIERGLGHQVHGVLVDVQVADLGLGRAVDQMRQVLGRPRRDVQVVAGARAVARHVVRVIGLAVDQVGGRGVHEDDASDARSLCRRGQGVTRATALAGRASDQRSTASATS